MKNIIVIFLLISCFLVSPKANAQLANGSTAPDFTLTDINGNVHHLYDYLNQGKTVFIDFSAAHCSSCWNYHNAHHLKTLYEQHGPTGTISQDVIVLFIEVDANNGLNEFNGISGNTQGNWLAGTPYPFLNPEGADRSVFTDYKVIYYPMVYGICPNKSIKLLGTQSATSLYNYVSVCAASEIEDQIFQNLTVYPNPSTNELFINGLEKEAKLAVTDMMGKIVFTQDLAKGENQLLVPAIATGMYFLDIEIDGAKKQLKWTKN
ncbi:MAG: T9SS type A sorting domain-containing protein [Bacteroidia bacterium]